MSSHIVSLFAATASAALIAAIWQGVLLAVCVGLSLRLLPSLPAAARSFVWFATFVAALLLHFAVLLPSGGATTLHEPLHADARWSLGLGALWLLLSGLRAAQLAVSALHLRRIARQAAPVATPAGLLLPRGAVLCSSNEVDRPSVVGFFAPRILIPPTLLAALSPADLEQILLHETEHLRRGDDWTNLLQKLALVVFPLNPVLLWLERRLCLERELACDDRVLRVAQAHNTSRKAYALCLAGLAEHAALRRSLTLALGAWEHQSELARRVYRILSRPQPALSKPRTFAATAALLVALLGSSTALSHAPQLVSFAPATLALATPAAAMTLPTDGLSPALIAGRLVAATAIMPASGSAGAPRLMNLVAHPVAHPASLPTARSSEPRQNRRRVSRPVASAAYQPATRTMYFAYRSINSDAGPAEDSQVILTVARMDRTDSMDRVDSPASRPPSHRVRAATTSNSPSPALVPVFAYAAVPTPNGWLFIKL